MQPGYSKFPFLNRLLSAGLKAGKAWSWRQRLSRESDEPILSRTPRTETMRTTKMARIEAALFVADTAYTAKRLAQLTLLSNAQEAIELIESLNAAYDAGNSAFRIERVAAGYRLLTRSELANWLERVYERQNTLKLSAPLLETVAIIAYRQPCTRAEVESIRGVQSAELIKNLMEKNLVRVVGEDDSLGRPYLYGTTKLFLEAFGLTDLSELPDSDRLQRQSSSDSSNALDSAA